MQIRTPIDGEYAAAVGKAVYVFAYYEWVIIYIIEQISRGFVVEYCRGKPMTSGNVRWKFQKILDDQATAYGNVPRTELQALCDRFKTLLEKRNALIHAHSITATDGSQILDFQGTAKRSLPDMKWPLSSVMDVLEEFDAAAFNANALFHRM
jgi:hypothetical protein